MGFSFFMPRLGLSRPLRSQLPESLLVFCYLIVPSVGAMLFADRVGPRLAIGWTMGTLVSALDSLLFRSAGSAYWRDDCVHLWRGTDPHVRRASFDFLPMVETLIAHLERACTSASRWSTFCKKKGST